MYKLWTVCTVRVVKVRPSNYIIIQVLILVDCRPDSATYRELVASRIGITSQTPKSLACMDNCLRGVLTDKKNGGGKQTIRYMRRAPTHPLIRTLHLFTFIEKADNLTDTTAYI